MTEPTEAPTAKHLGVGRRIARAAIRFGGIFMCIVAAALLWAANARAQTAPADQAAPKLTSEMCLGCHGVEGIVGAVQPSPPGSPPKVMTDRFLGSVHGKLINCVDCHTNITKIPHEKVTVKVSCINCHQSRLDDAKEKNDKEEIETLTRRERHGRRLSEVDPRAAEHGRSVAHQCDLL